MKIPLFDIDWTLIEGGNEAHNNAFDYALKTVFEMPEASKNEIMTDGMIDTQILVEILKLHGISLEESKKKMDEAVKAMDEYYSSHQDEGKCIVMPGVIKTLEKLTESKVPLGLLTGNIEGIGWKKVERAGLKDFFTFGSFGNLAYRRPDLIPIAVERANKKLGLSKVQSDFVIVGDSPLDVACAKAGNIPCIAVAAGVFSAEELKNAGAELVLQSLEETNEVISFLSS